MKILLAGNRLCVCILLLSSMLIGCGSAGPDLEIGKEYPTANEQQEANALLKTLKDGIAKMYEGKLIRRDAHPKHHACLQAEFSVSPDLPDFLQVGAFQPGKKYPAWIRYSNGSPGKADFEKNIRGMAIKLLDVEGEKLLDDEKDAKTQDFLLINHNVLVVKDGADFHSLVKALQAKSPMGFFFNPMDSHIKEFLIFLDTVKNYPNLLDVRYWSTTPYLFGEGKAVKYSAKPCTPGSSEMPEDPSADYHRQVMSKQLAEGGGCFDFMVQLQTDANTMLIEDARSAWDEEVSPFQKVATINIPAQKFESKAQMDFCEDISFTPWHSLPEHRPLGDVNRTRKTVYQGISKFRHEQNKTLRQEPIGMEKF